MSRPSEAARFLTAEALAALGRLRTAWPWLAEARIPGPEAPTVASPNRREVIDRIRREQHVKDRAARLRALSGGAGPDVSTSLATRGVASAPLGAHGDAARTAPIAARREVAEMVVRLADRLDQFVHPARQPRRIVWPVISDATVYGEGRCRTCSGTGYAAQPHWWPTAELWPPARDPEEPGGSRIPAGTPLPCHACAGHGRTHQAVYLDASDVLVAAALRMIAGHLRTLSDVDVAADAARTLGRADRVARTGARAGEHRIHIKAPCPACGARDLWAEVSSPEREEWFVRCESRLCACRGPACACGRPVRYRGRRHHWPSTEWASLSRQLGVALPDHRTPHRRRS